MEKKQYIVYFSGYEVVEANSKEEAEKQFDYDNFIINETTIDNIEENTGQIDI